MELSIATVGQGLTIVIQDDGKGIDPMIVRAGGRPGHWGLRGMDERAARIGARLSIAPRAQGGTRIELTVATGRHALAS